MGIRLLPKSEVDRKKAAEQKATIDEGAKLARRIDNLREVAAEEETALETFRVQSVSKINDDIKKKSEERDALDGQIAQKKQELKDAFKPLEKERARLDQERSSLDARREAQDERESMLNDREERVGRDKKAASDALARAETAESVARARLLDADNSAKTALKAEKTATMARDEAVAIREKLKVDFQRRDMIASSRERDVSIKEARLAKEQEELQKGWKLLKDRREMFEREIKRKK